MLSVVAMSSSEPILQSNFSTSEVSSTSNNNIMDVPNCQIKSEPDSEDSIASETVKTPKQNSTDDIDYQKEKDSISVKSEHIKNDNIESEDDKDSEVKRVDNSLHSPPPLQPKKSFMTSHILGLSTPLALCHQFVKHHPLW